MEHIKKVVEDWIQSIQLQTEQYGNGYATITVYDEDKEFFIQTMQSYLTLDDDLTEKEKAFLTRVQAEMQMYDEYKTFVGAVKRIFLNNGPESAKAFIKANTDKLLEIVCNELFWSLFTNL